MSPEIASGVNVACPACRKTVSVPPGMGGQLLKCPLCQAQFASPPNAGKAPAASPAPPAAAQQAPAYGPAVPAYPTGPHAALPSFVPQQAALPGVAGPLAALMGEAEASRPKTREGDDGRLGTEAERLHARVKELDATPQAAASGATYRTTRDERAERDGAREESRYGRGQVEIASAVQQKSDEWNEKPAQMMIKAGAEFYEKVKGAGYKFQGMLSEPGRFAAAWGADKLNPNAMGALKGSTDVAMQRLAQAVIPLVEGAAKLIDHWSQKGGALDMAGRGAAAGASWLGGAWRWGLNLPSAAIGERGKLGDALLGDPNKPQPRSMAGLPQANMGGMESFYDQALMTSLSLQPGTKEAEIMTNQIEAMSKTMGDLLVKLVDNTEGLKNLSPSFR